ncbi:glutamine amidotransferase [Luteimicrobium subarcticum]|uniref:GMP synthase (Glutamine-hydrolysing) n=1 Tax=Luteimicrobium subarcticum TaxID=620910 RepID=A0A2M8WW91_9MICO|nr:glutamine amidotransferase [Luteimicrobium subarcticum]PJI95181.1 GMP synthase (glutamine-hydrolysing) [Luteimicrobium subarcticum]
MKPFLLLATRTDDVVADAEYVAFCQYGGLAPSDLVRARLEAGPLSDTVPVLDLDDWSGVIIGGGPFNASDPEDEKSDVQRRAEAEIGAVLDAALARDVPVLGACYGVGILGTRFGGVVDKTFGEDIHAARVTLTPEGEADPLLAGLPRTFDAIVGHKEACRKLPPGAVLLATGELAPVQMFRLGRSVYATQFHPELDVPGLVGRIKAYRHDGYFPADEVDDVVASARELTVTVPQQMLARFVELATRR